MKWLKIDLDTPAVLIDYEKLKKNIESMSSFARQYGIALRPHIKTHKMIELAQWQMQEGAVGITAAKLGEAEVMAGQGIHDILIAYPILGESKLQRLRKLKVMAQVTTVVDGVEQAEALSRFAGEHDTQFDVLLEIDTGLKRCGVLPGEPALQLYQRIHSLPGVRLKGMMTHAGHAYGAGTPNEVLAIARQEGQSMVETAELLRQHGITVNEVSVGATPTVRVSGTISGVTEIRPGNYVFNDMTQVRLGVATHQDCALRVAARIVARPAWDRFIIDAGAKSLALDQGAHGTAGVSGYGYVVDHPELTITRLSEEHGIVQIAGSTSLVVGDIIEITPNHSCPVVNLTDEVYLVKDGQIVDTWKVAARGKTS